MAEKGMEEEFLTCSICYDVYKEPKTLSCLHRFCVRCLQHYIECQKKSALQKMGGFHCPVCREVIKSPEPHRDPSDWAGLFKTDFHLNNLIRFVENKRDPTAGISPGSPTAKQHSTCNVHKDKELDLYCLDCQAAICHLCAGISHRGCNDVATLKEVASKQKSIALKSWKALEKGVDEIQRGREKAFDRMEKIKAKAEYDIRKWSNEWLIAIQKEEQRLTSRLDDHFKNLYAEITPRLVEFDNKVSLFKDKARILTSDSNTLTDVDVVNAMSKGMDLNNDELSSQKNLITRLEKIDVQLKKSPKPDFNLGSLVINSNLETILTQPAEQIHPKQSDKATKFGAEIRTLGDNESVMFTNGHSNEDNPFERLDDSSSSSSGSFKQNMKSRLSKMLPSSITSANHQPAAQTKHKPPPPVPPRNKPQNNQTPPSHAPRYLPEDSIEQPPDSETETPEQSESSSDVIKLRTISTRFREDTSEPKLRDIIVTGQGHTVIVTDWANHSVKAFYVRREKDCRLVVGGKPWSITQLSPALAAVSLPLSRQICIIKITPSLMTQNSFVVAKNYSGLATLNSQMLVASGGSDPPSVDIINLFGEVLSSISTGPDNAPLFMYPAYVCVTSAMLILVSDKKQGAIFCMTHKGEIKFRFQPKAPRNLQDPCGLCTSPSGHVMVLETRGLLQLTPKGQLSRPVIRKSEGHVTDPKGIALDSDGLIYVTTDEQEVCVFKVN